MRGWLTDGCANRSVRAGAGFVAGLLASGCLWAHHSFAMFDFQQTLTLKGQVREFQWTNPHCFLQLIVAEGGSSREWSVEMGPPADLYRKGWRPGSLKAGDTVSVTIHPDKDGSSGGSYMSAIGPDGKPLFPESPAAAGRSDTADKTSSPGPTSSGKPGSPGKPAS